jgi:serine/threonine protein kinase
MYAMKVLDKNMLTDQRKLKQIENERKVMQSLNHPFIVKLYWAFQTNTTLNFIMDLCVGGELFYRLKNEKRLTESKTRFYLAELVLAFEYMHSKNIVYRDLKPENVIIDIDGHIKLADFGLSKELKKSHTQSF